jgi:glycosyltransferase involved in cell wall biosynthesis
MPSGSPKISVILPAYNTSKYIREALDSILNQTFVNFELLVADDGSTDDTRMIIDSYSDSRIITSHNVNNQGKTKTVNRLFLRAKGEFITIHDADDVSHPHRFQKQMDLFNANPELLLCGTSFYTINKHGFILELNPMAETYADVLNGIDKQSQFHGPTMMIRLSAIRDFTELYRPYFQDNYEDTDLAYRIVQKGKAFNLNEPLYVYRILDTSLCRRDVNIRNRNLYKVVSYLANQRKASGKDFLMEGKPELADDYLASITQKYTQDPALVYREAAEYYFYWRLNQKALESAWSAFLKRPQQLTNLRTYLYIIRKQVINFLKFDRNPKIHYKETLR